MRLERLNCRVQFAAMLLLLAPALWSPACQAQIAPEITIGITPRCPYPDAPKACFYGAFDALRSLEGMDSIDANPNSYNCTATVYFNGTDFPNVVKWCDQFRAKVHESYDFRGVECTVSGTISLESGRMVLAVPGLSRPLQLGPLEHKLQWNYRKRAARQPEPDEKIAFQTLEEMSGRSAPGSVRVEVRGPIIVSNGRPTMEVREWYAKPT